MAEVIRMPLLSDTMKEGKIVQWLKKVGDEVVSDDVLAEVQTDKATMEIVPYVDGTILHIGIAEGEAAAVNQIIAIVGEKDEEFESLLEDAPASSDENNEASAENSPKGNSKEESAATEAKTKEVEVEKKELPEELEVVRMPLLSDTMKEGKIVNWLKQVGDAVVDDDVLAEVETDKATMEVIGYAEGALLYQGVEAGGKVAVNGVLAIVGPEGTDIKPYLDQILSEGSEEKEEAEAAKQESSTSKPAAVAPQPKSTESKSASAETSSNERIKASPLAKKMAQDKGLDLQNLSGTGDGGRIIKRDIEKAGSGSGSSLGLASFDLSTAKEGHTDIPLSQMREVIAQKLSESKFQAPHFYLKISVQMDNLLNARKQINSVSPVKISINDMLIKASALSLTKHAAVNSSWLGDKIRQNHHVHIGSAVAIDEGLIVPVIKHASHKTLAQIASDANELYEKAKTGKLQPAEFTGNTFTISNLGMMGIDDFTAIINPPDACILAVGRSVPTPVVVDGQIVVQNIMRLTLSCDHRVVDGAVGARFLSTLKDYIENPVLMLI